MKKEKTINNLKIFLTMCVTALLTIIITLIALYGSNRITTSSSGNKNASGSLYTDNTKLKMNFIQNKIESEYIENNVDENLMQEYAIKGYVEGLNDVYSDYYTKEEMEEISSDVTGEYVGIGIVMTKDTSTNEIVVYSVFDNSPAKEVGIEKGDIITKVDDTEVNGNDYNEVPNMIKGKEGTKVKVTIKKNNEEKTFELTRKAIVQDVVKSQIIGNNIGYIYISDFTSNVYEQFLKKYNELASKNITKLIIDERNNLGGEVNQALNIADLFINRGETMLIEEDKNGNKEEEKAQNGITITMPTVLLVNEYSASASEILAGALKDKASNVTIVGTKTYGKGVIQSLYTLSDGSGLKLTTNKYLTPNGTEINKIGIEPDVTTDKYSFNSEDNLDTTKDTQLKKALDVLNK